MLYWSTLYEIYCCINSPSLYTNLNIFVNSFHAKGNFCHLLITFANSLDPDQEWQKVGPDLDSNCLTLCKYSRKIFLEKIILNKVGRQHQKH